MRCTLALLIFFILIPNVSGECVEIKVLQREPFAGGQSFGEAGPYERIVGVARFVLDPKHVRNVAIVDLDKAPVNQNGKVEFESDVFILTPKDPTRRNSAILYDVNNRGNKLALSIFNDAPSSNDPNTVAHAGNGFLMKRGYTIVWSGWIGELLPGNHRLLMKAPIATNDGKPITGLVRFETGCDSPTDSLPLSRREGHGSYNPTDAGEKEGTLTWRMREGDPRVVIPRAQWKLERVPPTPVKEGVSGTLSQIRLKLESGFRPGYLYELICECENPIVQGCGFAAVRDLVSFLRYDVSTSNPLAYNKRSTITHTLGFGASQSGRFLRHFVYQAFNADELNRKVFDGLMPHVAGAGLGFFNHRFAQPTRHNAQHEEHIYPVDVYPFAYGDEKHTYLDPTGKPASRMVSDGVLHRYSGTDFALTPKIFHTQTAAEYWHRSGSLVHTDPLGERDSVVPGSVRIYTFGSSQHSPASNPPSPGIGDNLPNPADFRPFCRALLIALDDWTRGVRPALSYYPHAGDLQTLQQAATTFPRIPGVRFPEVIQQPSIVNFDSELLDRTVKNRQPRIEGTYRVLVPTTDSRGNNRDCLLPPEVAAPLATYTGWNLRKRESGAEAMLWSLTGSYIPLPRTSKEAQLKGDTRSSLEAYGSFKGYRSFFEENCNLYVEGRYLLKEDADRLISERVLMLEQFIDRRAELLGPAAKLELVASECKSAKALAINKDGVLFVADPENDRVMKLLPDGKLGEHLKPAGRPSSVAFDAEGRLVMCRSNGEDGKRRVVRIEKDGAATDLASEYDDKSFTSPGDLCIDAMGRIYFTDTNNSTKLSKDDLPSAVYRIDEPGKVTRIIETLAKPKSLAFSPDQKLLYVSDLSNPRIQRFAVKEDGGVEPAGIVYTFAPDRGVDGMCVDENGNIWAVAGDGKTMGIFVLNKDGSLLMHLPVPEFPRDLCFGGVDNKDLFVAAGGSIYKIRTAIAGAIMPKHK